MSKRAMATIGVIVAVPVMFVIMLLVAMGFGTWIDNLFVAEDSMNEGTLGSILGVVFVFIECMAVIAGAVYFTEHNRDGSVNQEARERWRKEWGY